MNTKPPHFLEGMLLPYGTSGDGSLAIGGTQVVVRHEFVDSVGEVQFYLPPAFPEPEPLYSSVIAGDQKYLRMHNHESTRKHWWGVTDNAFHSWKIVLAEGPPRWWDFASEIPETTFTEGELPDHPIKIDGVPLCAGGIVTIRVVRGIPFEVKGLLVSDGAQRFNLADSGYMVCDHYGEATPHEILAYEPPTKFEPTTEFSAVIAGGEKFLLMHYSNDTMHWRNTEGTMGWCNWRTVCGFGEPEVWDIKAELPVQEQTAQEEQPALVAS